MRKFLTAVLALALILSVSNFSTAYAKGSAADVTDLNLTPGGNASSLNLAWYSGSSSSCGKTYARFLKPNGKVAVEAKGSAWPVSSGKMSHKVTVGGLSANTAYAYQVSNNGSDWSTAYRYKTAPADRFSFAYIGDPQLNHAGQDASSKLFSSDKTTAQGWKDTVSQIEKSGVNFILSAGDQIDGSAKVKEDEYTDFFAPAALRSLPLAPTVGNHDRSYLFLYHFYIPNEQTFGGIATTNQDGGNTDPKTGAILSRERKDIESRGNYFYSYGGALFVALNDSAYPGSKKEAAPFIDHFDATLKAAVKAYPNHRWLFVQHHKSTESVAQHVADKDIEYYVEAGFEKLMDKYHVDFVLAGHDHVYVRSAVMKGGKVTDRSNSVTNPSGTVYFTATTASGLKYYNIFDAAKLYEKDNSAYPYLSNGSAGSAEYLKGVYPLSTKVAQQRKTPGYVKVTVSGGTVTFNAYDANNSRPYDTFTVDKTSAVCDTTGTVRLAAGKAYTFKITSSGQPAVTVGNPKILQVGRIGHSSNQYWYRVKATGKHNQSTGVYLRTDGGQNVRLFAVTVK